MDLREFLNVFWKYRILFLGTALVFVMAGFAVQLLQPVRFATEITMNVARSGVRMTTEYAYDDFYRLQADERFADTVVRWLESPRIVSDILHTAKRGGETISFDADRLSSQVIRIRFVSRDEKTAEAVSRALFEVLNRETASLNRDRKEEGWFMLLGETPSISDARFGMARALLVSGCLGIFFGFLIVLLRWYWTREEIVSDGGVLHTIT